MNLHRRIGLVLITLSILLFVSALLLSIGWNGGVDLLPTLALLLRLQLFGEHGDLIDIPTKYVLLACIAVFAVGALFLIGVFSPVARNPSTERSQ